MSCSMRSQLNVVVT